MLTQKVWLPVHGNGDCFSRGTINSQGRVVCVFKKKSFTNTVIQYKRGRLRVNSRLRRNYCKLDVLRKKAKD